ncbi:hypothetical protein C0J52_23074, partial [Blattella germanica]
LFPEFKLASSVISGVVELNSISLFQNHTPSRKRTITVSLRIELYFVIDTICMAVSEIHLSYIGYLNIKYLLYIYMS